MSLTLSRDLMYGFFNTFCIQSINLFNKMDVYIFCDAINILDTLGFSVCIRIDCEQQRRLNILFNTVDRIKHTHTYFFFFLTILCDLFSSYKNHMTTFSFISVSEYIHSSYQFVKLANEVSLYLCFVQNNFKQNIWK